MNRCPRNGFLIGAELELPTDPTECDVPRLPTIGCNRLLCTRCGVRVRNAPGLGFRTKNPVTTEQLAELYDQTDLASSPLLTKTDPSYRLYLCRCSRWLETDQTALFDNDPDAAELPSMPWLCEGHPKLELPAEIGGALVATEAELRDLVVRGFRGETPPGIRRSDQPRGEWLARLHTRLTPTRAPVVVSAALASLLDPDAKTRGRALNFFDDVRSSEAEKRILEIVAGDRRLFAGIPDEVTATTVDKTLEESLFRVLGPNISESTEVREAFRHEALGGRGSRAVYDGLAKYDSEWLIDHLEEVAKACLSRAKELTSSLLQTPEGISLQPLRDRIKRAVESLS